MSNIGVTPDFSAIYTSNAGPHTATDAGGAQRRPPRSAATSTWPGCGAPSQRELPQLSAYFQSGGMVDAVLNQGLPAPIDVQVSGSNLDARVRRRERGRGEHPHGCRASATSTSRRTSTIRRCGSTSTASAPASSASNQREVVNNVITALTSNQMIAPSYWVDPQERQRLHADRAVPGEPDPQPARPARHSAARRARSRIRRMLDAVDAGSRRSSSPTEIDHYQIRRVIDIYVNPAGEDLGARRDRHPRRHRRRRSCRPASGSTMRGMVQGMEASFRSFGLGLILALRAAVSDPRRAVPIVHRSAADSARRAARADRRAGGAVSSPARRSTCSR